MPSDFTPQPVLPSPSKPRLIAFRVVAVAIGLFLWFTTQKLIGAKAMPEHGIGDQLIDLLAPVHQHLVDNPRHADALLIVSSLFIDVLGIYMLGKSIVGRTVRPFVAILLVFAARQACQALTALPPPDGMIWRDPGLKPLLVTYGVSNDLFFSGHTALAVLGAVELAHHGKRWCSWQVIVGILIGVFEVATVLALRAHYTMDVFAGVVAALLAAHWATKLAPPCDRLLARLSTPG